MKKQLLLFLFLTFWLHAIGQVKPDALTPQKKKPLRTLSKGATTSPTVPAGLKALPKQTSANLAGEATGPRQTKLPAYWPDRVLVKLKEQQGKALRLQTFENKARRPQTATNALNRKLQKFNANRVTELPRSAKVPSLKHVYEVAIDQPEQLNQLLAELKAMPEVAIVEKVPVYTPSVVLNDPYLPEDGQYALRLTKTLEALEIFTGTSKTALAVVDDAILTTHPDLEANIDLVRSYDVGNKDNDVRPPTTGKYPASDEFFSHGTHCAGIAGAVTNNNVGISSVSNNAVSLIAIKSSSDTPPVYEALDRPVEGIVHAINSGARVISMSFGGAYSRIVQDMINEGAANGIVFVAAAGNAISEIPDYPAGYDNVISVACTNDQDMASWFTNYGTWIDISAPGQGILSTIPEGSEGRYSIKSGTSMAAPMVAGLVALMLSENPNLTPKAVEAILKSSADPIDELPGQNPKYKGKLGAGRINAFNAIQAIQQLGTLPAPGAISNLGVGNIGPSSVELSWTAPAVGSTDAATLYEVRYSTAPITEQNFEQATKTRGSVVPAAPGTTQTLLVSGLLPNTTYYFGLKAKSLNGESSLSNIVQATTQAAPQLHMSREALVLAVDRAVNSSHSLSVPLQNTGTVDLQTTITLLPTAGKNVKSYDKPEADAEGSLGFEEIGFRTAVKFDVGQKGFTLTHAQNYLYNHGTVTAPVTVRVLKGGTSPADATLLTEQTDDKTIMAGGAFVTLALQEPQRFEAGETFWLEFVIPDGLYYPQGYDITGNRPDTFLASFDDGLTYHDAQMLPLGYDLSAGAPKIRALDVSGLSVSPSSATVAPAGNQTLTLTTDPSHLLDEEYRAQLLVETNDPLAPAVTIPVLVQVTGGQPQVVLHSTSLDFGSYFKGLQNTQILEVQNHGNKAVNIQSVSFNGGTFAASDFTVSPTGPLSVPAGENKQFEITFAPTSTGPLAGSVTVHSDDATTPGATATLTAEITNPPVATVTPSSMTVSIDKATQTSATRQITLQNTGAADLEYSLLTFQQLKYDSEDEEVDFLSISNEDEELLPHSTASKFTVTQPKFILSHVQNHYSTTKTQKGITVQIIKGGETPAAGELLLEQTYSSDATATPLGNLETIPLTQQQEFEQGDVFWVVFNFEAMELSQGFTYEFPEEETSFFSLDQEEWSPVDILFKIRALDMTEWLAFDPAQENGTLPSGASVAIDVEIDPAQVEDGMYAGRLYVASNDPANPMQPVSITLEVSEEPTPVFTADKARILVGESIEFKNASRSANAFEWTLEGATTVSSQEKSPIATYTTPGIYKVSLVAKNTLKGKTSAPLVKEAFVTVVSSDCQELNTPFAGTPSLYANEEDGDLVTGHNSFGDLAKANLFAASSIGTTYLNGTKIRFGLAEATDPEATMQVAVWSFDQGEAEVLYTQNVKISDLAADVEAKSITQITFDSAVTVTGSYFVGIILNYESGTRVGVASNAMDETPPADIVGWEQWADGDWYTIEESWGDNLYLFIQPSVSRQSTPLVAAFEPSLAEVCQNGQEITFDATATTGASRLVWTFEGASVATSDAVSPTVSFTSAGTHNVTLTIYDDCGSAKRVSKTITVLDAPLTPTVTQNGSLLTSSLATGNQWFLNGTPIEGATAETYTVLANGDYSVQTTNAAGCFSAMSAATTVTLTALEPEALQAEQLKLYPNPTQGEVTLSFDLLKRADVRVQVVNATGHVVHTEALQNFSGTYTKQLNLKTLPAGLYLVQVITDGQTITRRLFVQP